MWKLLEKMGGKSSSRNPRILEEVQVHFRRVGDFGWSVGRTFNISRSGALFGSIQPMGPKTRVEMEFIAPRAFGPDGGELVGCRGEVVRALPSTPTDRRHRIAVKFSKFQNLRQKSEW